MSWETLDNTLIRLVYKKSSHEKYSAKLAMFDLDHTLVKPRQGKKYPKNAMDWMWWDKEVPKKLTSLCEKGFTIIIITNQAGAEKKAAKSEEIMERIQNIFQEITDICSPHYIEVYVSLAMDIYRKPNTTIFETYILPQMLDVSKKVFYIGDAAGRKEDFSDSDRKFAFNLHLFLRYRFPNDKTGVPFATPEEFFLDKNMEERHWIGFDPREYCNESKFKEKLVLEELVPMYEESLTSRYVILLIGPPASGKSTLSEKIESKYGDVCYVNQDICRTKENCLKEFSRCLRTKKRIILIDNTNPEEETRKKYSTAARLYEEKMKTKIYIVYALMKENDKLYAHLNIYRERISFHRGTLIKRVPEIAYRMFYKRYKQPSDDEDMDKIINIDWIPNFHTKYEILMFLQKS
jgi:bifunctional polynucleotide phosphatase/kinase